MGSAGARLGTGTGKDLTEGLMDGGGSDGTGAGAARRVGTIVGALVLGAFALMVLSLATLSGLGLTCLTSSTTVFVSLTVPSSRSSSMSVSLVSRSTLVPPSDSLTLLA